MTENKERNIYQDVPNAPDNPELTSSIGGLWPPEEASFNRIKGIYTPNIIRDKSGLEEFLGMLDSQTSSHSFGTGITRISLRAVIDCDLLRSSSSLLASHLEVAIPLNGTKPPFEETALIYVGSNHPTRRSNPDDVEIYRRNLSEAFSVGRRSSEGILRRVSKLGYDVQVVGLPEEEKSRRGVINQIYNLYRLFGWSKEEVDVILTNPNNIVGVATYGEEIVSAGIAEVAHVPVGSNNLRMVEITEAATSSEHARNGLYTAVSTTLLKEVARLSKLGRIGGGEVDLVFGECNGNAVGVLRTAKIQGRTFACEIGEDFGFPESGMLSQHVPISGVPKATDYNDLFPAFMVKDNLYKFYGSKLYEC